MAGRSKPSGQRMGLRRTIQQTGSTGLQKARTKKPYSHKTINATEHDTCDNTTIHVAVRCRSRNERETEEDDGVVIRTEGIRGKTVELLLGSLSSKSYNFDRVFSSAADQRTVYEDAVLPMLDEMLLGYNCTIFAYGQTGTGKTYTMSGEMVDEFGILTDNAGIIPRVLYSVFHKLKNTDSTVKCSFIELYNEDLRDLLSEDENTRLQLFENERNGANASILVKGIQETYISSPSAGIELLKMGSQKRQVAATKCNDLSSRSHTIFTIHVLTRQSVKSGEEYIISGKLNLVDLAGSENIQRSGAENKRAVEAGQINKSLLTLGRVINALVDKSSHVPYRESKLTRLLQDSLGGRTKTCIIATVSPCRSNLEESISTLDYAFRAKNIRNKPQINPSAARGKLLAEFTTEIEKLKSNLTATRQRNGIYMTPGTYEEMMKENASRRLINSEQKDKIEALESGLRHKTEECLALKASLQDLKHSNEDALLKLNRTNEELNETRLTWQGSVTEVSNVTEKVETRMKHFQIHQIELLHSFSDKIRQFLEDEIVAVQTNESLLHQPLLTIDNIEADCNPQLLKSETEEALNELKEISGRVRTKAGEAVNELSQAIARVSLAVHDGLLRCNDQIESSCSALNEDFHSIFETMVRRVEEQEIEISKLRNQLQEANDQMTAINRKTSLDVTQLLQQERASAETERERFLSQISELYDNSVHQRWNRLQENCGTIHEDISRSDELIEKSAVQGCIGEWTMKQKEIHHELVSSADRLKKRIYEDRKNIAERHFSVRQAVDSTEQGVMQIIDNHSESMNRYHHSWVEQLHRTRLQTDRLHDVQLNNLNTLAATVQQSCSTVRGHLSTFIAQAGKLQNDLSLCTDTMKQPIDTVGNETCESLSSLRASTRSQFLPTGATSVRPPCDLQLIAPSATNANDQQNITCSAFENFGDNEPSRKRPRLY